MHCPENAFKSCFVFWMGELNVVLRVPKVIGKLIDGSELYQRFKDAAEHRFID